MAVMQKSTSSFDRVGYQPEIDGLRAIAVLMVVFYHANVPYITGGYAGVDVFFVISGYLITLLLVKEKLREGHIDLWAFYARRAKRLLPGLFFVLVVTIVAADFILSANGEKQVLYESAFWSSVFLSNFYFLGATDGYFAGSAEQFPLLHLLSLCVE